MEYALTERLRRRHIACIGPCCENQPLMSDAAVEIESLTQQLATLREENERLERELHYLHANLECLDSEIDRLKEEIGILRLYGNKDCTAQADEALERRRSEPPAHDKGG